MPFFSIIVPVYNAEKYLDECVESVLHQSFSDYELILIDDGSLDKSPEKCDAYAKQDNRIKVLHKENGGASDARNAGLNIFQGEYVIFLDSDDFYNRSDALQLLYDKIAQTSAQIVIFGCTDRNIQTGKEIISRAGYNLELIDKGETATTLHYLLSEKMIPGGPTIFAVNRDVIEKNNIRYHLGIQDEDYDFVLNIFMNSKSIYAVDVPFYTYRHGISNSVTGTGSIKMIYGIEYTVNKWFPIAEELNDKVLKRDLLNYIAFVYITGFVVIGRMNKDARDKALKIMDRLKYILEYGYWRKIRITKLAVNIIGMRLFSILAAVFYNKTHV